MPAFKLSLPVFFFFFLSQIFNVLISCEALFITHLIVIQKIKPELTRPNVGLYFSVNISTVNTLYLTSSIPGGQSLRTCFSLFCILLFMTFITSRTVAYVDLFTK